LLLSLSSCIKDDVSDCPQSVSFTFRDSGVDPDSPIGSQDLRSLMVYIFDENDNYIGFIQFNNPNLNEPYAVDNNGERIMLGPGKYSFVAWSNIAARAYNVALSTDTRTPQDSLSTDSRSNDILSIVTEGTILGKGKVDQSSEPLLRLFYGNLDEATVAKTGNTNFVIDLYENTNLFDITVVGLPRDNQNYSFVIEDSNGKYNFRNDFGDDNYNVSYETVSQFTTASDNLNAQLRVLKLARGRTNFPLLYIFEGTDTSDSNAAIFQGNLLDYIDPATDFSRRHYYQITITYQPNGNISITINGWKEININNGIEPN